LRRESHPPPGFVAREASSKSILFLFLAVELEMRKTAAY
jgi:hypothetical protein